MTIKRSAACASLATMLLAGAADGAAQVRPPVITDVSPWGLQRGTTVTMTVDGTNIADADRVLFTHPGITARIVSYHDLGVDLPTRRPEDTGAPIVDRANRGILTLEVAASSDVPPGRHGLRLRTPFGTTTFMSFQVGSLPEALEVEPNDDPAQADSLATPVTVSGRLFVEGDRDVFRVAARAGVRLVVRAAALALQSRADPVLELTDEGGTVLARSDDFGETREPLIVHTPPRDGTLWVRVSDALNSGSPRHVYRLTIGDVPFVTRVFPLGVSRAAPARVRVEGVNLGRPPSARIGRPDRERADLAPLVIPGVDPLNRVEVALGPDPEISEREHGRSGLAGATPLTFPVTVNGRLYTREGAPDEDLFSFTARAGQQVVVSVAASRLGSPLDSVVEVLDATGRPIPRAVLRPVWETSIDLRSRDSLDRGLRLLAWSELHRGDWVYVDRELIRVADLPKGPDEDVTFEAFRGRRLAFLDTTSEGHALGRPVYKVELHKPGARFSPNGLPTFTLYYRNDDGGPMWGRDSRLTFTAPRAGTYHVRLTDARGESGEAYAYRLTLAPPRPDFDLFVTPANPNVPRGGRVPLTVHAYRRDGFEGAIDIALQNVPPGLRAQTGRILPGQATVSLTLEAEPSADSLTVPLKVVGSATVGGRRLTRVARSDERISVIAVAGPPDVRVTSVEPSIIELAPGGRARVRARIQRENGFTGRVPLAVLNLPVRVTVPDIGLNGILITESQDSREFDVVADANAPAAEQTLFVTARVETNQVASPEQASVPIRIRVAPVVARQAGQ